MCKIEELKQRIKALQSHIENEELADDRYHVSGRYAYDKQRLSELQESLKKEEQMI